MHSASHKEWLFPSVLFLKRKQLFNYLLYFQPWWFWISLFPSMMPNFSNVWIQLFWISTMNQSIFVVCSSRDQLLHQQGWSNNHFRDSLGSVEARFFRRNLGLFENPCFNCRYNTYLGKVLCCQNHMLFM